MEEASKREDFGLFPLDRFVLSFVIFFITCHVHINHTIFRPTQCTQLFLYILFYNIFLINPIASSILWNVTFTWIPDDDFMRDRKTLDWLTKDCNIEYLKKKCILLDWIWDNIFVPKFTTWITCHVFRAWWAYSSCAFLCSVEHKNIDFKNNHFYFRTLLSTFEKMC